ncbi:DUF6622 family protein [Pseudoduganella albidiflava]|uniref:DUF1453 domain-containing protein n=1 Tax=Pseudoduganella albidiflava TaxID=321983 RepID=A0A411X1S8_9BURK|nr:DUF6622 family protein [Pseudoduganella albidiflava]QBI02914.1 hypothetical protein EYF70_20235 [Pseudoduganella albidiflava]GGY57376.1 hypothetical protein GCM10007387_44950 [Pseudoduganella albidiflava]
MLQQIVTHTPFHIWLLLGVLVWRGLAASRDRAVTLRQALVLPVVLLALSVQDMANRFGFDGLPAASWLAGTLAAAMLAWRFTAQAPRVIAPGATAATVLQRGSWLPLALMLATFATKYAVAASCAVAPALAGNTVFATTACALYGMFNGLFAGRALRCLPWPYRRHATALSCATGR